MEVPQRFCVRWNSYKSNLQTAFPKLLTSEHFVDVTLACEKQFIKCHKIVLSACSAYFETLLVNNPCQHPIIFMKDIQFWEIKALVDFMYKGEVNVSQNQLDSLLKSAESLQIRGLSGTKQFKNDDEGLSKCEGREKGEENEKAEEEVVRRRKRRCDEVDDRNLQITTVKPDEVVKEKVEEPSVDIAPPKPKSIKEEAPESEDFDVDSTFLDTGGEEDGDRFAGEDLYSEQPGDAGPSGISEFISLDQLDDLAGRKLELEAGGAGAAGATGAAPRPRLRPAVKLEPGESARSTLMKLRRHSARRSCYKQYTMSSMWAALERIEQGLSVYRASLEYGVPRKTLRNWMKKYNILSYFDLRKQEREKHGDCIVNLE